MNKFNKKVTYDPTVVYVAESERDAERLRGQLDVPVRVQGRGGLHLPERLKYRGVRTPEGRPPTL